MKKKLTPVEQVYCWGFIVSLGATIVNIFRDSLTGVIGCGLIFVGVCIVGIGDTGGKK